MAKHGSVTWHGDAGLASIRAKLIRATERASAEGADRAAERAPVGKGSHAATGSNPRFFAVRLQTLREFDKERGTKARRFGQFEDTERGRLIELRSFGKRELIEQLRTSTDVGFFRISEGSHRGEKPDVLGLLPRRGSQRLAGAVTHYQPGRLKKEIHPLAVTVTKLEVKGGWASEAPYSNIVEHGFHHKGGTEVEGRPFMRPSVEELRPRWNDGSFFEE